MIKIEAPYPNVQVITFLPSPEWNDSFALAGSMNLKRAMDGTVYTTIKTSDLRLYKFQFNLTRLKALELKDFFEQFAEVQWSLTLHNDDVIVGYCKTNPLVLTPSHRSVYAEDVAGKESVESVGVELEIEGVIL